MSAWLSALTRKPLRRVTRPESGWIWPVSTPSRLDLPSPFRPTMPIRAPSFTPSVTDSNTTWFGYCQVYCLGSEQVCHRTEATDPAIAPPCSLLGVIAVLLPPRAAKCNNVTR